MIEMIGDPIGRRIKAETAVPASPEKGDSRNSSDAAADLITLISKDGSAIQQQHANRTTTPYFQKI
jgi:hypothetical protein